MQMPAPNQHGLPFGLASFAIAAEVAGSNSHAQALTSFGVRGVRRLRATANQPERFAPKPSAHQLGPLRVHGQAHGAAAQCTFGRYARRARVLHSLHVRDGRHSQELWLSTQCQSCSLGTVVQAAGKAQTPGRLQRHQPRPNPSLEARPNGKPPGPAPGCAYHPSAGPGVLPSVPPQLER